ncbi:hypothetical protein KEM48_006847 [Puccinia striiformis f. sp. tritici PST-130]|nr:hypothetical protein KEM48_006847 [Puccinia striiformis f. sp. tritici PST-130]
MSEKRRVKGLWIHRPIVYGSVATAIPVEERLNNPEHNMRWTVAVRSATSPPPDSPILAQRTIPEDIIGGCDDLSYFIKKVSFKLHDSYPNPLRVIDKSPFELSETGWGEFIIYIKFIFMLNLEKKQYNIPPVWLNDDPTKNEDHLETGRKKKKKKQKNQNRRSRKTSNRGLYTKLIANPPTPLPPTNRYPPGIVKQIGNKGEHGEFTSDISQREFKKLDWAELKLLSKSIDLKVKSLTIKEILLILKCHHSLCLVQLLIML